MDYTLSADGKLVEKEAIIEEHIYDIDFLKDQEQQLISELAKVQDLIKQYDTLNKATGG